MYIYVDVMLAVRRPTFPRARLFLFAREHDARVDHIFISSRGPSAASFFGRGFVRAQESLYV